ncbi:MAG: hypothetical protein M1839_009508 [Geoglossum umbratile]|nr:MAG: hypothetical protein M1839_009508 [Geoglossum umbratile]
MSSRSPLFFGGLVLSTFLPSALAVYTCTSSDHAYGGISNIRETCAFAGLQLMTDMDNLFPNDTISLPALGANSNYNFDVKQDFCHVGFSPTDRTKPVTAENVPMKSLYDAVGSLTGSCVVGSQTFGSGQWKVTVGAENHVGKRSAEPSVERAELMALKAVSSGVQKRDPSNRGNQLRPPGIGTLFRLTVGFVKSWFSLISFPAYSGNEDATVAGLANDLWNQLNAHLTDAGPPLMATMNRYTYQVTMEMVGFYDWRGAFGTGQGQVGVTQQDLQEAMTTMFRDLATQNAWEGMYDWVFGLPTSTNPHGQDQYGLYLTFKIVRQLIHDELKM